MIECSVGGGKLGETYGICFVRDVGGAVGV